VNFYDALLYFFYPLRIRQLVAADIVSLLHSSSKLSIGSKMCNPPRFIYLKFSITSKSKRGDLPFQYLHGGARMERNLHFLEDGEPHVIPANAMAAVAPNPTARALPNPANAIPTGHGRTTKYLLTGAIYPHQEVGEQRNHSEIYLPSPVPPAALGATSHQPRRPSCHRRLGPS
jgi:hypothetical protein